MSSVNIDFALPTLHPAQEYIFQHAKRFNHLRCGRRFGKTTLIEELSSVSLDGWPVGIWFPTYKDLSEVWKDIKKTYNPIIARKDEQLKQITLITGGLIDFWSMEDPDSGQGRKYKRAVIDEAAKAPKLYQAWENTIRPTLTDYRGDAFILSRPKGKNNGFFLLEEKHRQFENWQFFHFTTYDNPHIAFDEIEEAKNQLDEINFQQEYMAEYVDANDRPFLYAFSEKKHIIESYEPNPHLTIVCSFDFNRDPMTCVIGQRYDQLTTYIFDEIEIMDGSSAEVCDHIRSKYTKWDGNIEVTGDATGRNRSALTRGNLNHYRIIKQELGLTDRDLLVGKTNLANKDARVLCNSVLQNANVYITKNCKKIIHDCRTAYVDSFGELVKTQAEGLHFFDGAKYFWCTLYKDFIKRPDKYHNSDDDEDSDE
jgi:hypothetical protein